MSTVPDAALISDHYYAVDLAKLDQAQEFVFPDPSKNDDWETPAKPLSVELGRAESGAARYEPQSGKLIYQPDPTKWPRDGRDEFPFTLTADSGAAARTTRGHVYLGAKNRGYVYYRDQQSSRAEKPVAGISPGLMLAGGGKAHTLVQAFRWLLEKANGGDVVVLRTHDIDYYPEFLRSVAREFGIPVNSIQTIAFTYASGRDDDPDYVHATQAVSKEFPCEFVKNKLEQAAVIFVAGGDQWEYVDLWKDSIVAQIIHDKQAAGRLVLGGTSAGCAILGHWAFSAQGLRRRFNPATDFELTAADAMQNPYTNELTLENRFLSLAGMSETITDTHFGPLHELKDDRDRMGRLATFLARMTLEAGVRLKAKGLGVSAEAAVLVEADRTARVVGSGYAYFLKPTQAPAQRDGSLAAPLEFARIQVKRVGATAGPFRFADGWVPSPEVYYVAADHRGLTRDGGGEVY